MAILPLEYYRRRVLTSMDDKFRYSTTKGPKLIIPGTLFGCRLSHDGKKIRCIINDEVNKVFTLERSDYEYLMEHSIDASEAKRLGYI